LLKLHIKLIPLLQQIVCEILITWSPLTQRVILLMKPSVNFYCTNCKRNGRQKISRPTEQANTKQY